MVKLAQLLDARRRDGVDPTPTSPLTIASSTPVSPAVSLFSAKGHTQFSSSVSSLVSSPGHGNSMESASRNPLTGVKEEPCGARARDLEEEYFQHFDQGLSALEDSYLSSVDYSNSYDLTDSPMDVSHSPKKRRSDSVSAKGLSRIGSRISTISTRWKSKRVSDDPNGPDAFVGGFRSRTNSASSARGSPGGGAVRLDAATVPPSPARTIFEERISESGVRPIDIARANHSGSEDCVPHATTPLLPPFMGDEPMYPVVSRVHSPLQSPSVADISNEHLDGGAVQDQRTAALPSPPLSTKPSIASFNRPRASTTRTVSTEVPPFLLTDPKDEWAKRLGHANFTIYPEPYAPEVCDVKSLEQLRTHWDLAHCNFTKHLVRTGEHYGITSNIYKLTEEKWECINSEWKHCHEVMLSQLGEMGGAFLSLPESHSELCEPVKIPRLHDEKFPDLGDGEIVGPMKIVAPASNGAGLCRTRSFKRNLVRFFQDLVSRS